MKNESCYKYLHLFNDSLVLKIQLMQIPSLYRLHLIKINANILLQIYMLFCRYFHNFDISFFKNTVYLSIEKKEKHFQILPILYNEKKLQ